MEPSDHELEAPDWSSLQSAYGSADVVPSLLRAARADDPKAWFELWGTVWHQGTVYGVSPHVVPYLADLAITVSCSAKARCQAALLLASIATAHSFVLPEEPLTMRPASWLKAEYRSDSGRDLVEECRAAVAVHVTSFARALPSAPLSVRAALIAALGSTALSLTSEATAEMRRATTDEDRRVAAAVGLVVALAEGNVTSSHLWAVADLDEEARDYLESIADWPTEVQAAEIVRELCERVVSESMA